MNLKTMNPVKWSSLTEKYSKSNPHSVNISDLVFFNSLANEQSFIVTRLPCGWNIKPNIDEKEQCLNNNSEESAVQMLNFKSLSRFDPLLQNPQSKIDHLFADTFRKTLESDGYLFRKDFIICNKTSRYQERPLIRMPCKDFNYERNFKSRIVPFFISNRQSDKNANLSSKPVTLTTQISFDRIERIENSCSNWQGPLSVAVYLTDTEVANLIQLMANNFSCLMSSSDLQMHLVFRNTSKYPTNLLRNVAMKFVETPYVFILDADFLSFGNIQSLTPDLFPESSSPSLVVIPAFEFTNSTEYV